MRLSNLGSCRLASFSLSLSLLPFLGGRFHFLLGGGDWRKYPIFEEAKGRGGEGCRRRRGSGWWGISRGCSRIRRRASAERRMTTISCSGTLWSLGRRPYKASFSFSWSMVVLNWVLTGFWWGFAGLMIPRGMEVSWCCRSFVLAVLMWSPLSSDLVLYISFWKV